MVKKSINLIPPRRDQSQLVKNLNILLPVIAIVCAVIFVSAYFITLRSLQRQADQYSRLKTQYGQLNIKLSAMRTNEYYYVLAKNRIDIIEKILARSKNFNEIINYILGLYNDEITIDKPSFSPDGNISLSVAAASYNQLDSFINTLLVLYEKKVFQSIIAGGVNRDKKGRYIFGLNIKIDPDLLKSN